MDAVLVDVKAAVMVVVKAVVKKAAVLVDVMPAVLVVVKAVVKAVVTVKAALMVLKKVRMMAMD